MFDSFLVVPLHFTVEFLGFLVTAAGAFLVASRPALIPGGGTNRGSAILGFAALAAAQVGHGGSFPGLESDGDEILVALKTFGFALILIGVVGGVRQSAGLFFAQPSAVSDDPMAIAPALAAASVALMAFVSSVRGATKDLRRLAFGMLLLALAEGVLGLSPLADDVDLSNTPELASHVLRVAGYLALASWLWTGVRSSIRTRFVASFVALLVLVVLALSVALTGVITNNVESGELVRVSRQMRNVKGGVEGADVREIGQNARLAADNDFLATSLAQGGSGEDLAAAIADSALYEADAVVITNRRGDLRGYAGHAGYVTTSRTRNLQRGAIIEILGVETVRTVVEEPTFPEGADLARVGGAAAVIGVAEIPHPAGQPRPVGIIVLVDFLDQLTVQRLSNNIAARTTIVVGDEVSATRLSRDVEGDDLVPPAVRDEVATDADGIVARTQELDGARFYSAIAALERTDRTPVGYLVLSSPASVVANTQEGVTRTMFLVALAAGAVVLILAYVSGSRITRPIQMLTETARRVREGDLQAQTDVSGEDEVGQLGETFNEMTGSLMRMTSDLRDAAREEHLLRTRTETIIESMADGLVAVDSDRKILLFNREAEELTGVARETAEGSRIDEVLHPTDQQGEEIVIPIFDLAEGSTGGIFLRRSDGDIVPVAIVSAALRNEDGATTGGVAVLRDMTREREVERMKSEFLSNISHELRTPLTPIKGYAEILLRKDMPPEKSQQFTRGILDSTARLERIVELLVDFAALEAGRLSPRSASVDLVDVVTKLAGEWEQRTPRHTIVTDIGGRLPKVTGDERLLRRSLEEILDNAVKFSPEGGTITMKVKGAIRGNGHERRRRTRAIEVIVSDEGIGIAPEELNNIFSDFHQLDGSETRSYGGLGLGLAFVRRIIEAHDGLVSVRSEPDGGTQLTVSIPAAVRPDDDQAND